MIPTYTPTHGARTTWIGGHYPGAAAPKPVAAPKPAPAADSVQAYTPGHTVRITGFGQWFVTHDGNVVQSLRSVERGRLWMCEVNGVERRAYQRQTGYCAVRHHHKPLDLERQITPAEGREMIKKIWRAGGQVLMSMGGVEVRAMAYDDSYRLPPKSKPDEADAANSIKPAKKRTRQGVWYAELMECVLRNPGSCLSAASPESMTMLRHMVLAYADSVSINLQMQQIKRCRDGRCRIWVWETKRGES